MASHTSGHWLNTFGNRRANLSIILIQSRKPASKPVGRRKKRGINWVWVVAAIGGGSNAIGLFHAFLQDPGVRAQLAAQTQHPAAPMTLAESAKFFEAETARYRAIAKQINLQPQ